MTKSALLSYITTKWGDITSPRRTPTLDRDVAGKLVDELFQTTTRQTITTGSDVFWCDLFYKKQGNIVHINGYITNKFTVAKSNVDAITIPDALYNCKTGQDLNWFGFTSTGIAITTKFSADKIKIFGSIAANQTIYINHHYQVND